MTHRFDWLVLTASSPVQASAYATHLESRRRAGALSDFANLLVVPDPMGRRVGSGGSTLIVLAEIARRSFEAERSTKGAPGEGGEIESIRSIFADRRILIVHSGGDSRRLPAYAAQGKVFTPLPIETSRGLPADLLDVILDDTSSLVMPEGGGVLVLAGDLLVGLAKHRVDFNQLAGRGARAERMGREGITGVAFGASPVRASRHGVYVIGRAGAVASFLQKPTRAEQRAAGAIDRHGRVLVDTGVVAITARTAANWMLAAGLHVEASLRRDGVSMSGVLAEIAGGVSATIDLYDHVLGAVPRGASRDAFIDRLIGAGSAARDGALTAKGEDFAGGASWEADQASDRRDSYGALFDALHATPFHAIELPSCEFLHVGTTREMLEKVTGDRRLRAGRVQRRSRRGRNDPAVGSSGPPTPSATVVFNSGTVDPVIRPTHDLQRAAGDQRGHGPERGRRRGVDAAAPSPRDAPIVIEACDVRTIRADGDNLIVGLPRVLDGRVDLPRSWGIVALPIGRSKWCCVLFGSDDDGKTPADRGGTLGGRPLTDLAARGVNLDALWTSARAITRRRSIAGAGLSTERSLWTARLWVVGDARASLQAVRWMTDPNATAPRRWSRARRVSLAELMSMVNHGRLIAHRAELRRRSRVAAIAARACADRWIPAASLAQDVSTRAESASAARAVIASAAGADPIDRARLLMLAAELSTAPGERARLRTAAFSAVGESVRADAPSGSIAPKTSGCLAIPPGREVRVTSPARIDLAGGWSDTPPICHELGGSVVNAAVALDGTHPLRVIARRLDEPAIRITSLDLGRSVTLTRTSQVIGGGSAAGLPRRGADRPSPRRGAFTPRFDPHDWSALAKAALVLAGLVPHDPRRSLSRHLATLGGGADLTISSALPKGSGLGTSSILGAAVLAALDGLVGVPLDHRSLIHRTSRLEQLMSTGGGWQDQVGGITPGFKINRTEPGPTQIPTSDPIAIPGAMERELSARSLLYYSGYRRLARDILSNVVARHLRREPESVRAIRELKDLAERTRDALVGGDVDDLARCVRRNWELKKILDPGATNERIERILAPIEKHLTGYEMPGAGGGGFLYLIARDERSAAKIRKTLRHDPPNAAARFFSLEFDRVGLTRTVV